MISVSIVGSQRCQLQVATPDLELPLLAEAELDEVQAVPDPRLLVLLGAIRGRGSRQHHCR